MNSSSTMRAKLALLLLSGAAIAAAPAVAQVPATGHHFEAIQRDLFAQAGSLSNAWADFDKDGDLDFAVTMKSGAIHLYRNDGGTFVRVGEAMGLPVAGGEFRAISWADYDGDGWLDLFAGSSLPDKPSALFRNVEGKRFENVAEKVGLTITGPGRASRQNNWIDVDNDGDLDLYATDRIGKNRLYSNDRGTFAQMLADAEPTVFKSTVGACWLDYDQDGKLDLFLANQSGKTDSLFHNEGDRFVDVAPELGMDMPGRAKEDGGVGCAVGDFDNDGLLDIFVPNYGKNVLWKNDGKGGFNNVAAEMGLDAENHAVGASWGDYDNDGFLDLYITSYHGEPGKQTPADALFHNEGGKRFVNVIDQHPIVNDGDHGVEWVDYDGDGAIDLTVTHGYSAVGGHFIFRNVMPAAQVARAINIMPLDGQGRPAKPGTEVRIYDSKKRILATRMMSTGGGYGAQSVTPLHFGLQSMDKISVAVTWLTAKGRQIQWLQDVSPAAHSGKALAIQQKLKGRR